MSLSYAIHSSARPLSGLPKNGIFGNLQKCPTLSSPSLRYQRCLTTTRALDDTSSFSRSGNPFPLPSSSSATPYDIFHLSSSCTSSDIKSRYYDLVKIYHPDRVLSPIAGNEDPSISTQEAHENFKRIRDAYSILCDEAKRRMYDRSGWGWGSNNTSGGSSSYDIPIWKGGYPRTAEEWAMFEAWSSHLRRGSPGTTNRHGWEFRGSRASKHDQFGWQHFAGDSRNRGSDWFYGFGQTHAYAQARPAPLYTSNGRFMFSVASLTIVLAIMQYARLQQESQSSISVSDRRHQDAAKSLDEARKFARSDVGRTRVQEIRRRRRETEADENNAMIPMDGASIGHGGASGRAAYEERMRRIGAM